jgi:hypothetical protein
MDDLELLIGLLGVGAEFESAMGALRKHYHSRVRTFLARLLPFCSEEEISREAENVLAQFAVAVQRGEVRDETEICSTLIKQCRRGAADVISRFSDRGVSIENAPTASQCDSIRDAVATSTAHQKVVLRELLRRPGVTDRDLFSAARATMPTITLLDVIEARRLLAQRVKEVIDGT